MASLPIVYVKTGCPWCESAVAELNRRGIRYELRNVTEDRRAFAEMEQKSNQSKAPTMDWNGKILADFGVEELIPFLKAQGV